MQILERIYIDYCEEYHNNVELNRLSENVMEYEELLRNALSDSFFDYENLMTKVVFEHQKQSFMAGFEMCKQLLLGGK